MKTEIKSHTPYIKNESPSFRKKESPSFRKKREHNRPFPPRRGGKIIKWLRGDWLCKICNQHVTDLSI